MREMTQPIPMPPEPAPVHESPVTAAEILNRIQAMKAQTRWDEIIRAFHPLEERHPQVAGGRDRMLILQEIAFALSQRKSFAEAIRVLLRCQEEHPGKYAVVAALGFNHYNALMSDKIKEIHLGEQRGRYVEEADRWFGQAEQLYPASVVDFYRHGMLFHHIMTKKDHRACPLFEQAVAHWEELSTEEQERRHKDRKNYVKALYHLAKARLQLGRYAEAEDAARRCLDVDRETDHEEPIHKFYLLGKILLEAGRPEEAESHLRNAAHMRTQRPKDYVFYTLAQCLCRLERFEEALEWMGKIPPRFLKPHMKRLMGWLHYRLGNGEEAGKHLDGALQGDRKGRHITLLMMGEICQDLGRWEDAVGYFRQANEFKRREFLNDYDEALYRMGQCLMNLGDQDGARDAFHRTLLANDRHHEAARAMRELLAGANDEAPPAPQEEFLEP